MRSSYASHCTNTIWELLLTWRTSSLIAKLCKEWEKEYFSILSVGSWLLDSLELFLQIKQVVLAWLHVAGGKSRYLAPIHDRLRSQRECGLTWQLTWANCELLLFFTSSHMFLSFPLQLCDLMWRKNKKTNLIFIWLSSWINTCKIKISRSQLWEAWQLSWINACVMWSYTTSLLVTGPTTLAVKSSLPKNLLCSWQ